MGKIENGIMSAVSGKVGPVIGSSWKGIQYLRSRPSRPTKPCSPLQLQQQKKFKIITCFVNTMKQLFELGFKNIDIRKTGINNAISYNLKNAINAIDSSFEINYSKVMVTRGDLPNANSPLVVSCIESILKFNWINNSGEGIAKAHDQCIMAAWSPEINMGIYALQSNRENESGSLAVKQFLGLEVNVWISFISAKDIEVADSRYLGKVLVL